MKKIQILMLVFFSMLIIACKNPEFHLDADISFSADFISQLLGGKELIAEGTNNYDYSFCGIPNEEARQIIHESGDIRGFASTNIATELKGLSLKKVYTKKGAFVSGWIQFENELPQKVLDAYDEFKKTHDSSMNLYFREDKKSVDYSYTFATDSFLLNNDRNSNHNFDIADFNEENKKEKKKQKAKAQKLINVKLRGGKIVLVIGKEIEGLDGTIVLSRIRN